MGVTSATPPVPGHGFFVPLRSFTASPEKKCTAFSCDNHSGIIAVAKSSEENPGRFGILKISSLDVNHHEFVYLHDNTIRDVAFDPHGNTRVLSCSRSKELKMTCLKSNTTLVTYATGRECWSCGWSPARSEQVYCGLQNGQVMVYDVRNTRAALDTINPTAAPQKCPVISVISPAKDTLLVSTLKCMTLYKMDGAGKTESTTFPLPPGALSSVTYDATLSLVLASYKPGLNKHQHERHVLMTLNTERSSVEVVQTFSGSSQQSVRSRSCLMRCPDNDNHVMVCAGNQAEGVVNVWTRPAANPKSDCLQKLASPKEHGPVIAVNALKISGSEHLIGLTNQRVVMYKWQHPEGHSEDAELLDGIDDPVAQAMIDLNSSLVLDEWAMRGAANI